MKFKTLSQIKGTWYIKGFTNEKKDAVVATPEEVKGKTIIAVLTDMRISRDIEISSAKKEGNKWCIKDTTGAIELFELEPKGPRILDLIICNSDDEKFDRTIQDIIRAIKGGDRTYRLREEGVCWVFAITTSYIADMWIEDGKLNAKTVNGTHYISSHYKEKHFVEGAMWE